MPIIKPPVKNIWADTGDKTEPTAGEVATGWPLSSTPPSRQRFNWILNYCANAVRYFSRRGVVDYDAAETYAIGDRVIGDDGNTYKSLQNSNINHTPSTSPTFWELWATSVTTASSSDNTLKVATTAWFKLGYVISLTGTATNYIKFPNCLGGLIIQWGVVFTSSTADTVVTYGLAFPTAVKAVVGTAGQDFTIHMTFQTNTTTLSSFNCNAISIGGRNALACSWIAVGH